MAQCKIPVFEIVVKEFLCDRSSPSPIPEDVHLGLVNERDVLCPAFVEFCKDGPEASSHRDLVSSFVRSLREAAEFVRRQHAPSSHVWSSNIFGAIVSRMKSSNQSLAVQAALTKFDEVARSWEALVQAVCSASQTMIHNRQRYKSPFLHTRDPIAIDTVTHMYYSRLVSFTAVSFKNILFAVCAIAYHARLYHVPVCSSISFVQLSPADVKICLDAFDHASSSIRSRLHYMAAAAAVRLNRRLLRQSNSRQFFSRFRLVDDGRSQSIGDISEPAQPASKRISLALHVRRCVDEIWKDITATTTQVSDTMHDPDMAYIYQQSRGMLRMPQKEFASFYALIVSLCDLLLSRVHSQESREELPDELAQIHSSVSRAAFPKASIIFAGVPQRLLGWEEKNTRALCRYFARYALLTAYRQLQRRSAMLPADWFGASTCSFRQASTAMAATAASRLQRADKSPSEFPSPASCTPTGDIVPALIGAPVLRFACTSKEACLSSQGSKSGLEYGDTIDTGISSDAWIDDCEVELQEMCDTIAEDLEEGTFIRDDDSDSCGEDDSESGSVGGMPDFCIAEEDPSAAYDAARP